VAVVNTREWHFFPTGRVLVRFRNHHAGPIYPFTLEDISDSWGAYQVEPKPDLQDILHLYADNVVRIQSDLGEEAELTLEDGRRHLFWDKDHMLLSEWATEQEVIPCEPAAGSNPTLMNTGLALMTSIEPDEIPEPGTFILQLHLTGAGGFSLSGTAPVAGDLVIEGAASLGSTAEWSDHEILSEDNPAVECGPRPPRALSKVSCLRFRGVLSARPSGPAFHPGKA